MAIEKLFGDSNRVVGLVGSRHQAKTSLALNELINLSNLTYVDKKTGENIKIEKYVYGVSEILKPYLKSKGIKFIENKEDILDLSIRNCIIYLDEIADVFDVSSQSKQQKRFKRFINRLNHLNVWIFFSTAENKFWNSFVCGLVENYMVKGVEYLALVNGTELKTKVMGISIYSDYRLVCPKNTYYIIGKEITEKNTFEYNPNLDSKKDNFNPFKEEKFIKETKEKNSDKNSDINGVNPFNLPVKTISEELK